MKKLVITLSLISVLLVGCMDDQSPIENITILNAKVIKVKYYNHYGYKLVVEALGKTLELVDNDNGFYKTTQSLLTTASKVENDDLITFDFIVTNDLYIKAFSLSKNRQH